ncbi:MAG: hypothetical protein J6T72_02220 [Alphaproteobacteria bacterium]|nr:hypothetical protein [Alphaproteobacteria bacterium]
MTTRQKILNKQPLSDEEIRQLIEQKKEYLVLLYLGYCPLIYAQELWLVNSGMKKALRKQIKLHGLSYPQAEVDLMKPENIEFIKLLIKEQMVCYNAEIALKNLGSDELNNLYRKKHRFFMCER